MNALLDLTTSNTTFLQAALEAMPANEAQAAYVRWLRYQEAFGSIPTII
ncbi:MAG: hypothetical protein NZM11_02135 [Anaerolineales bacterium]|nr:hypothetical protein [Anaerolineales bacterium]MDW8327381.1 hypothetical protein [Anaerolineales bacterium]